MTQKSFYGLKNDSFINMAARLLTLEIVTIKLLPLKPLCIYSLTHAP